MVRGLAHISKDAFWFPQVSQPGQPMKTRELGNLDTYVPFPGNLANLYSMETSETQEYK